LNVLSFSSYNFHLLRSWMQLVQLFISSFFTSFLMSSSHLFFGLPSGRVNIGFHLYTFLPLSVAAFDLNDQTSLIFGPGSAVGIATSYGLDGPGIESRWGRDFPHLSRPTVGHNQAPVQWVPGLSRGERAAGA
jgi:hypothetical protein